MASTSVSTRAAPIDPCVALVASLLENEIDACGRRFLLPPSNWLSRGKRKINRTPASAHSTIRNWKPPELSGLGVRSSEIQFTQLISPMFCHMRAVEPRGGLSPNLDDCRPFSLGVATHRSPFSLNMHAIMQARRSPTNGPKRTHARAHTRARLRQQKTNTVALRQKCVRAHTPSVCHSTLLAVDFV